MPDFGVTLFELHQIDGPDRRCQSTRNGKNMSLLTREPPRPVDSMDELLAIAHAMEHEAATRYSEVAHRLRAEGNPSLADVFEHLAAEERGHIASVTHWSEKERGKAPDPALVRWKIPETFDDEGASITDPRLLSTYRTLSMAVRNEERAFAFWTYVAAHAKHADVRRAAERMAGEELHHVATLRRERRRAYHLERSAAATQPSAADEPAALERRLADQLDARAAAAAPGDATLLRRLASQAREAAEELTREPLAVPRRAVPESILNQAVALSELLVDRYLEAAERLTEEQSVSRAQAFAGRAIQRLAWLRADLPELDRAD